MTTQTPDVIQVRVPHRLPWQDRVVAARKRFNVLVKGRRAGGTTLAIRIAIKALMQSKSVGWFSATYKLLAEAERDILARIKPTIAKSAAGEHRYETITGGVLEIWSLEGDISARGRKYDLAVIDEAAFVDDMRDKWEQQIRPALADKQGHAWFVSSPNGHNYLFSLWERGQDPAFPDWAGWQLPTWDNPRIAMSEIESARAECDESNFRQEWGAEFVVRSGAVFPSFSRNRHVREMDVEYALPIHVGMDFGFRTFAAALFQITSAGEVHIVDEYGASEAETWRALEGLAGMPHGNGKPFAHSIGTIGCDPAGEARNLQTGRTDVQLVRAAFPTADVCFSTDKRHRDPEWGAARLRDLLLSASGNVRLYVHPRCRRIIRTFEGMVYPKHADGKPEIAQPVKDGVNDHWFDAMRYGLINAGVFGSVGARTARMPWL